MEVVYRFTVATTHSCLKKTLKIPSLNIKNYIINGQALHILKIWQEPSVKPVPADLSQLEACFPHFPLQKIHLSHVEICHFQLHGCAPLSKNIKIIQCNCDNNKKHSNNTNKFPILFSNLDAIKSNRKNKIKKEE